MVSVTKCLIQINHERLFELAEEEPCVLCVGAAPTVSVPWSPTRAVCSRYSAVDRSPARLAPDE